MQGLTDSGRRQARREEIRAVFLEIVGEVEQVQRLQMRAITSSNGFLIRRLRAMEAELARAVIEEVQP